MENISSLKHWKEEYIAITKAERKQGITEEIARRMLIWTEGFMMKTMLMLDEDNMSEEDIKIAREIRKLNLKEMKRINGR